MRLLADLRIVAGERGTSEDYEKRFAGIRARHAAKSRFIERLDGIA